MVDPILLTVPRGWISSSEEMRISEVCVTEVNLNRVIVAGIGSRTGLRENLNTIDPCNGVAFRPHKTIGSSFRKSVCLDLLID